jgi:glycolate oxidase
VQYGEVTPQVIKELESIVGPENVLTAPYERALRSMTAAPFPYHKLKEIMPDVVVLPASTEEVSEILKLANKYRIPVTPRAGGTGLADGAVPLRRGILLDIKRMDKILELDEDNMCVTVQAGVQNHVLNDYLRRKGYIFPDDPCSQPGCVIGGRIGTSGWSLIPGWSGHVRDLVRSMIWVLPTGKIIQLSEGGGRKLSKSSTGYTLKHLFFGAQGTLGVCTEATLEIFPLPEAEFPAFWGFKSFVDAWRACGKLMKLGMRTVATFILFDEAKLEFLRRDDEAYIPLPKDIRSVLLWVLMGPERSVEAERDILWAKTKELGGIYLGEELSEGDWAARHDRYGLPLHGRDKDGYVCFRKWHCEDAAIPYSELPEVFRKWHAIVAKYRDYGFDDWGCFAYVNNPYKPWGDFLTEIDIGLPDVNFDERTWNAWVQCKREISLVTLEHGGSISACHGGTRPGDVELVPKELGEMFELMKMIKRMLDPNNIMNPGKYLLDEAYK